MDVYWDPIDIEIDTDPYGIWKRLRDEAPVYRNDKFGFYALSRYEDVERAHRQPQTYLSSHGTVMEIMSPEPMSTGLMIFQDPPSHTRLRSMVQRAFTPKRVAELEGHIRSICRELLAGWKPGESFDFVADFGAVLPSMVICELLGVPAADRAWTKQIIDTTFYLDPERGMINDVSFNAQIELHGYLSKLLEERRANPGDDLLSALLREELTHSECCDFATLLVSAGTETVAKLLGWAAVILAEHPEQRADLAANPELATNAVEELLRFEAPSPVQGRWTAHDIELHGTTIPKDSKVLLLTGSAGRDERKYPEAERFDVRRTFDHHVSFGFGIHFCIGASLARLEGRVALTEALAHAPAWEVDHDRAERVHTSTVRGWSSVPVMMSA